MVVARCGSFVSGMYDFVIYTDGGYSMCRDIGAFAYVILQGDEIIKKGAHRIEHETNNRAELKAILAGCYNVPEGSSVLVRSDSQYALYTLSGKWSRNKNVDIFECWDKKVRPRLRNVEFEWVRGHSGNEWNELCDALCNEAAECDLNDRREWIRK